MNFVFLVAMLLQLLHKLATTQISSINIKYTTTLLCMFIISEAK